MTIELKILVGTQTGTAELVAQELELRLDDGDIQVRTTLMDDLDCTVFEPGGLFLICTSTFGQGDVPDNAQQLYESLKAERPDLSHVRYGVFTLGDRTYADTFCNGGKRFDRILSELGARRIGDVVLHDASAGTLPEDVAADWIDGWIEQCREVLAAEPE